LKGPQYSLSSVVKRLTRSNCVTTKSGQGISCIIRQPNMGYGYGRALSLSQAQGGKLGSRVPEVKKSRVSFSNLVCFNLRRTPGSIINTVQPFGPFLHVTFTESYTICLEAESLTRMNRSHRIGMLPLNKAFILFGGRTSPADS
jgi:hypothetical protein